MRATTDNLSSVAARRIDDEIRQRIAAEGKTFRSLARASGVDVSIISRFMAGKVGLHLATAANLLEAFGLRLDIGPKHRKRVGARGENHPLRRRTRAGGGGHAD